jgi:hypothetical protein
MKILRVNVLMAGIFFLAFGLPAVFGQFDVFSTDSFNELRVGKSTLDETLDKLGQPAISRTNVGFEFDHGANWFKNWFGDNSKRKIFKRNIYKNIENFKQVDLYFQDDKLVWIRSDLKDPFSDDNPFLSPNDLDSMFDIELRTFVWAFGRKLPPIAEFGRKPDHKLDNKTPFYYLRIGVNDDVIVSNAANNNNENLTKSFLRKKFSPTRQKWEEINSRGPMPGYITSIQLISRELTTR